MLGVIHMGIATATSAPEMLLTEDEARELATATVPVLDLFEWMPDPRYAAIGGLLVVAGKIYIPRGVAIAARSKSKPRPAPAPVMQPSNVAPFPAPGFAEFGEPTKQ